MIDTCDTYSEMYVFADDTKFFRHIVTADDCNSLQQAVDALQIWSRKWLPNLNIKKCQKVSFGRYVHTLHTYSICDTNNHRIVSERGNEMLDLGVMFDEKLTFKEHMHA